MKSTSSADQDLQATLQSFMASMPSDSAGGHSKKIKLTTVHPEMGQPMTVEMEQSTPPLVYSVQQSGVVAAPHTQTFMAVAPQSILAQALPGGALIEKMIGGHISYIIIPICGLVIAWSYHNLGPGHVALGVAMNLFLISIVLELTAKFMTFPVVEASLDKKLETQRVRLQAKSWYREWIKELTENIKATHIKKIMQWAGIGFAFMGCFVMMGYFLQGTAQMLAPTGATSVYSTNVSQDAFMVR